MVERNVERPDEATTVVCVVPQRLEEGQEIALDKPELELALGQPVAFPLYTSTVRGDDAGGTSAPGNVAGMSTPRVAAPAPGTATWSLTRSPGLAAVS